MVILAPIIFIFLLPPVDPWTTPAIRKEKMEHDSSTNGNRMEGSCPRTRVSFWWINSEYRLMMVSFLLGVIKLRLSDCMILNILATRFYEANET